MAVITEDRFNDLLNEAVEEMILLAQQRGAEVMNAAFDGAPAGTLAPQSSGLTLLGEAYAKAVANLVGPAGTKAQLVDAMTHAAMAIIGRTPHWHAELVQKAKGGGR